MMAWLKATGYTRTEIGFYGLVFLAFSVNFLWSPLVDRLKVPFVHRAGQRRGWILAMQWVMAGACLVLATVDPSDGLAPIKYLAFVIAAAAATQDIAIDAYRIELVEAGDDRHMALLSAMATAGWWTGFSGLGALPFLLVDRFPGGWPAQYGLMAFYLMVLACITLFLPREKPHVPANHSDEAYVRRAQALGPGVLHQATFWFGAGFALWIWLAIGLPGIPATPLNNLLVFIAGLLAFVTCARLFFREDSVSASRVESTTLGPVDRVMARTLATFAEPVRDFFQRTGVSLALAILLFIFLFKIGEAFLGRMSIVFYKEVGFTDAEIGTYSKLISWWVTIAFSLLGGWVSARYGLLKGLFSGGIAMAASNLMFAWLAFRGPDTTLLAAAVIVDGFTSAWSTVAFVGFLSILCSKTFSAAQYAALASLGTLGRTFLASYSGWVVDLMGGNWPAFFVLTALMVIPSLILLAFIRKRVQGHLDTLTAPTDNA
ncbi:MAG: MFS transporter permease [Gammaproteobacteria bacterium]|nr:MAG: MFS transporter permease [Gammaproteobacteria bacterium]